MQIASYSAFDFFLNDYRAAGMEVTPIYISFNQIYTRTTTKSTQILHISVKIGVHFLQINFNK